MGAWIETDKVHFFCKTEVAPLVGAWIETTSWRTKYSTLMVAPLVGAWIETFYLIL